MTTNLELHLKNYFIVEYESSAEQKGFERELGQKLKELGSIDKVTLDLSNWNGIESSSFAMLDFMKQPRPRLSEVDLNLSGWASLPLPVKKLKEYYVEEKKTLFRTFTAELERLI